MVNEGLTVMNSFHINTFIIHSVELQQSRTYLEIVNRSVSMKAVFMDHNAFVSHYKEETFLNVLFQISVEQPIEYKLHNSFV